MDGWATEERWLGKELLFDQGIEVGGELFIVLCSVHLQSDADVRQVTDALDAPGLPAMVYPSAGQYHPCIKK